MYDERLLRAIREADVFLIGASNGLSISEGLHLFADNLAFEELFGDLKRKYGLRSLLHGMTARWPSEEEKWGFWSRAIQHYCLDYKPTQVMSDLKEMIGDRDYFIVTSNGERHFQLCGFAEDKIYEVEGSWLHMQCQMRCHEGIYPAWDAVEKMASAERNGRIPAKMVPHCPVCGGNMQIHMCMDESFIPNTAAERRFQKFISQYQGKKILILELGIGLRNRLIKPILMYLAVQEPWATYVTINLGEIAIPKAIEEKSFALEGDIREHLAQLKAYLENGIT